MRLFRDNRLTIIWSDSSNDSGCCRMERIFRETGAELRPVEEHSQSSPI